MKNAIKLFGSSIFLCGILAVAGLGQNLPEGEWRLASYNFTDQIAYPVDKMRISLNIREGGKLGGKAGCNVYGGNYSIDDGKLKISDIISTMMACEEPSMQFERHFFATLAAADGFALADGELTISDPKTHNFLRFVEVTKPAPNKCE